MNGIGYLSLIHQVLKRFADAEETCILSEQSS